MKKGTVALFSALAGAISVTVAKNYLHKDDKDITDKTNKYKQYYAMLNQWLMLKQSGKSITDFFTACNYNTIAIYGLGEMGNRLYNDLKGTDIVVKYAIDRDAIDSILDIKVILPNDSLEPVDAIVVTATFDFGNIEANLKEKTDIPIVSLEEIVFSV